MNTPEQSQENIAQSAQAASAAMPEITATINSIPTEQRETEIDPAAMAAQMIAKTADPDSMPERVMRLELAMENLLNFLDEMKQEWGKVEKLFKEFGL